MFIIKIDIEQGFFSRIKGKRFPRFSLTVKRSGEIITIPGYPIANNVNNPLGRDKKMKKKIVSIFLAASMALSLCACGDTAGKPCGN